MNSKFISVGSIPSRGAYNLTILICGDRKWSRYQPIYDWLLSLSKLVDPATVRVIHGAAPGADELAGKIAESLGFFVQAFPADWGAFGKAAGPIRNRKMLDEKPDLVLAFHEDIKNSKGTKDCIGEAAKRKIPNKVIRGT